MTFEEFTAKVEAVGLQARCCHAEHWQILGGKAAVRVNVWPHSKRGGFRYQVCTKERPHEPSRIGSLNVAIAAAGPPPKTPPPTKQEDVAPWEKVPWLTREEVEALVDKRTRQVMLDAMARAPKPRRGLIRRLLRALW